MNFRNYLVGEPVVKFYSNGLAPFYKLSNFALINDGITFDGHTYCSTEHAFQAQKYIPEHRVRSSVEGDLGKMDASGFQLVSPSDKWQKKRKYWMKKNNIGVIAKMATNPTVGKRLGLIREPNFVSTDELWMSILTAKFSVLEFRIALLATANNYLLEFDRGAKRNKPKWGGIIEDGILYGDNLMGRYLMEIRGSICV
jgi:predicted NAD-dependent protein-ADP-ribosyltransferase YbiA (DUF1768 family)